MKKVTNWFKTRNNSTLNVLYGSQKPDSKVLYKLSKYENILIQEAFTTQGILQKIDGCQLLILDDLLQTEHDQNELLQQILDQQGIPVTSPGAFLKEPDEWISQANLKQNNTLKIFPPRQVIFTNYAGGVGKTTLSLAFCKRFAKKTELPVALLELNLGESVLHTQLKTDLSDFFSLAVKDEKPTAWHGVNMLPLGKSSFDVLWQEDQNLLLDFITKIRDRHSLFVIDAHPSHPLLPKLYACGRKCMNFIICTPREDTLLQANSLLKQLPQPSKLVINMTKTVADRSINGDAITLPYKENLANTFSTRLSDSLLELVYPEWNSS